MEEKNFGSRDKRGFWVTVQFFDSKIDSGNYALNPPPD